MAKQLTIKDIYNACKREIANGNGNKFLVVSDDNEGNGYHGCFFAISPINDDFTKSLIHDNNAPLDEIMILG